MSQIENTAYVMNKLNASYRRLHAISKIWKQKQGDVTFRVFSTTLNDADEIMVNYSPDNPNIIDAMYTREIGNFLLEFTPYKVD